ncbi:hypothetical protein C7S20_13875 [Christiangramia fulva]|uniref:Uncharacterized protein n=1 Tax=Christiangramia fulva TaxID=2126553 RepID=A0A2R3Z7P7_9FLAO|nr:hypothetical protein [Christiangramia fulva]AVR46262.1 hypothetical protein C7S20_13875 [Christiangramia fulva]
MKTDPTEIIYFYLSNVSSASGVILHRENCHYILNPLTRKYAGLFPNQLVAFQTLKQKYPHLQSCRYCLQE